MSTFISRASRIFVYMLMVFGCALLVVLPGLSNRADFGLLNAPLVFIVIFFPVIMFFLLVVLAVAYAIKLIWQPKTSYRNAEATNYLSGYSGSKTHDEMPTSRFAKVDAMLSQLSHEERAYLERQLGAGELVVGDDGELVTLEEYRKKKSTPGEGGRSV
jgi:hypothetical protein